MVPNQQGFARQSPGPPPRFAPSPLAQQRRFGDAFCSLRLGSERFLWLRRRGGDLGLQVDPQLKALLERHPGVVGKAWFCEGEW